MPPAFLASLLEMKRRGTQSSEQLLTDLLAGDPRAWEELVREYSPLLFGLVRKTFASYGVPGSTTEFEDAVAEVWKNLLENERRVLRQCHAKGNFLQTLYVLARHRAIDVMRRRRRTFDIADIQVASLSEAEPSDELAAAIAAVRQLPQKQQVLVNLFFLQRKTYREITELTGMPQNSIGPTIARALSRLRKALQTPDAV